MSNPAGRYVLVATILASSMAFIDGSALNFVLSTLQTDLGASGTDLLWVVNAYALMLASLILIGGALGDQYGRNRVFSAGILVFTLASIACGLSPDARTLVLARIAQGIGGALMIPGSLAIIAANFAADRRTQAIGIWSAASTITTIGGPILGGYLADNNLWRAVFFINIPLAAVALWALRRVPETRSASASRALDIPGAVCITLGLGGITYGLITAGDMGIGVGLRDPGVLAALLIGAAALVGFVIIERRSPHPMVNLKMFESREFTGANLMTAFLYGALSAGIVFLALNLTQGQGYQPSEASYAFMPFPIFLALLSPWAGRWAARVGSRIPLTLGPALVGAGFFALSLPGMTDGISEYFTTFFPGIALTGIGMGITVAPLVAAVFNSVPVHSSGAASGINNAVTRAAAALTTALFGAVALVLFAGLLRANLAPLELTETARALIEADARDLAETAIPADALSPAQAEAAGAAVRDAFVVTTQWILRLAALLCVVSALLSAYVLRDRRRA